MIRYVIQIISVIVLISGYAAGNGKMFIEHVPPNIPYQRAIILFDDATQTLILQSKYELSGADGEIPLGWVVPVPAVPEVATTNHIVVDDIFMKLSISTAPGKISLGGIISISYMLILPVAIIFVLLCRLSKYVRHLAWCGRVGRKLRPYILEIVAYYFVGLIFFVIIGVLSTTRGHGVEEVLAQRVGIYDLQVITGDDSRGLVEWLDERSFSFGEEDIAAFDSYIERGWCFVVARVNQEANSGDIISDGLPAPLIMRFPTERPIYPLALTGTGGHKTKVLIYILSQHKMTANGRMTLRYADWHAFHAITQLAAYVDPPGFFDDQKPYIYYVSKFRDILTPRMMREDILFMQAADNEAYREPQLGL